MRSSFFEFHVAGTGLHVARAGLNVTGHNISNAATIGYSRQYSKVKAGTPMTFFDGKGMVGTGAVAYGVGQIRSAYLDKKYWSEVPTAGEYGVKSNQLELVEGILNELSGTGLKDGFGDFFKSLQDLSTTSGDYTYRTSVVNISKQLSQLVNNTGQALQKQQKDINEDIKSMVTRINDIGKQIESLNRQIFTYELDGSAANDLRDQRALLVDELSQYVNVNAYEKDMSTEMDGSDLRFIVEINSQELVNHFSSNSLLLEKRTTPLHPEDAGGLYNIKWNNGSDFKMNSSTLSGELKGLLDIRDGKGTGIGSSYKGIPYYLNKLNKLVQVFSKAVNEGLNEAGDPIKDVTGHANGYGKNGDTGYYLFSEGTSKTLSDNMDYSKITWENFCVNPDIVSDLDKLATSVTGNSSEESDNSLILGIIKISQDSTVFAQGKLEDYVIGITGELGISKKQADDFYKNYSEVVATIDNQRISVSGVDTNEEMIYLVKYNQMYQTAAKLINIIDGIYDTTINKMGV